jgi:hypothetical protein
VAPPLRVMEPAIVTQPPSDFCFWIAYSAPGRAGRMVPEKRTSDPRRGRVVLTFVLTRTATASVRIGLVTLGRSTVTTRYCAVAGTTGSGNAKTPFASVTSALRGS